MKVEKISAVTFRVASMRDSCGSIEMFWAWSFSMVGMGKEVLQKLAGVWGNFGLSGRRIGDSWGALR